MRFLTLLFHVVVAGVLFVVFLVQLAPGSFSGGSHGMSLTPDGRSFLPVFYFIAFAVAALSVFGIYRLARAVIVDVSGYLG
jgi:hypothetical protein